MSGWELYYLSTAEKKTSVGWLEEVGWEEDCGETCPYP